MEEGLAREFVNKIQHLRKTTNFDVQDKVHIRLYKVPSLVTKALQGHQTYICQETQAAHLLILLFKAFSYLLNINLHFEDG